MEKKKVGGSHIMTFGKYKGETLDAIADKDAPYIVWLNENAIGGLKIKSKLLWYCREEANDLMDLYADYRAESYGDRD